MRKSLSSKKILIATILTAIMMVLEIFGGWIFNSMALLADGWHMSSHMVALGLAILRIEWLVIMLMTKDLALVLGKLKF
jgi:Co/Zn/Cd efflux system component